MRSIAKNGGDEGLGNSDMQSSSLTLFQTLLPPIKSIGSGFSALHYAPQSPVWQCSFSRNGTFLAACYGAPDPCVRIWRYQPSSSDSWVLHAILADIHERTIRSIAFAPIISPTVLAAASFDGTISIWEYNDSDEWICTAQLEGHDNEVKCVAWNSTGSLLASSGRDKAVWLWESFLSGTVGGSTDGDFECIAVLNGHDGDVKCVQFASSHGQWGDGDEVLLSAGYDESIKVWAEDSGDWYCALSIKDVHKDTIWCLAVSPGSGRLLSASADGSIAIFKSYTETERKEMFEDEETSG